ncbi:hypothetical protein PTW32_09190 [Dechloromonas agitata]|uniref:hypothetical protein n=1 Tax=Dechloromonas agitata TaxID=73030 RepID=UPI00237ECA31|nr:hypothetical protein [Dechloromonas agitata]MDE1545595.1 hypothetical protein [Dechloromonas agitata]
MKRTRPIHRTRGDPGPAIDHWLKWPLLILLAVFVLALFWAREQAEIVLFGLRLLELAAALAVLLAAAYGALVYQDQRRIAAREIEQAAAADAFWNPERLNERVKALAEPYWRALAANDIGPVAASLTEDWRDYLTERLAGWRQNRTRPVLLDFAWREASVVGLEDWQANHRDRVTVRVDVQTSFHVTHLPSGELVEGFAGSRPEQQLWTLARGKTDWLIAGIELVGGGAAYRHCTVFREAV